MSSTGDSPATEVLPARPAAGFVPWLKRRFAPKPGTTVTFGGEGPTTLISTFSIAALFALWWFASHLGWLPPLFLPTPETVFARFVEVTHEEYGEATLAGHLWASLVRVFSAFFLACVTAIPLGILMGINRVVRGLFDPPIEFYRPLPPLAYLPLIVIWFGIGEFSKILLIYLAIFAPLALSARAGVRSVSVEQVNAALSLGASRLQVIAHVILNAALPEILTGMRIGMGFGWTTLVAAEMVAATRGLGQMVLNASNFLVTDVVIMGILVIGAIAFVIDFGMRWLEHRLVPWKGRV